MNHFNHIFFFAAGFVLAALFSSRLSAQTRPTISYQGMLETSGTPVSGSQSMALSIYTSATGGTALWSETQTVDVENGIFNVLLGSVKPLTPFLDFKQQYYFSIAVAGGAELTPRVPISFAPYSFRALYADSSANSANAANATHAATASNVSGGVVTKLNGFYGPLDLIGEGGTTVTDSGTSIVIRSQTFTGGTGIQAVQNLDGSITIVNGSGPIATITLARQNADTGQVLRWNGSAWKPATLSSGTGTDVDSIKDLQDARDDGSSVYLGAGAGVNNSGKNSNVSLGIGALHSNTTGYDNVALGDSALLQNDKGWSNVAIGMSALNMNTGPYGIYVGSHDNTACGDHAMANARATWSSAFGSHALEYDSSGGNAAFGNDALWNTTTGGSNSAFGYGALGGNITGIGNTAIGKQAGVSNTAGSYSVAIGYYALYSNYRSSIVAVGDSALYQSGQTTLDSSVANTAVGSQSLVSNTGGAYNTGTGYHTLYSNSVGYRNTGTGYNALAQNVSGNDNTAIGASAGPNTTNLDNTTAIGSGAQATSSNEVVLGNGNVTSLYCMGAYAATTANSANLVVTSTGQIMRSTSSERYKTDIHNLDFNADRVYDLRPVSYTSKMDGKAYFGLVAEQVATVLPELVEYAPAREVIPGSKSEKLIPDAVKYPMLSVVLLQELKKAHAEVEAQQKQIAVQGRAIADIESRLKSLEASQKSTLSK